MGAKPRRRISFSYTFQTPSYGRHLFVVRWGGGDAEKYNRLIVATLSNHDDYIQVSMINDIKGLPPLCGR